MRIIIVLLWAAAMLGTPVSVPAPAHALNGCNPQVSKC